MIQAIISLNRQIGMEEWRAYYHSKTFTKDSTIQEIEDWAKTYGKGITFFDIKFATHDETGVHENIWPEKENKST